MENPIIAKSDYNVLKNLVTRNHHPDTRDLGKQISSAEILTDEDMPAESVRLNSYVEVFDPESKRRQKIRIVMPDSVDLKKKWISVFAPLSVALLGHLKGDTVQLFREGGAKSIKITDVVNHMP